MNSEFSEQEFDPFAYEKDEKKEARKGKGGSIAWLALVLALATAGVTGWQWWQERQAVAAGAGLEQALSALRTTQARALQAVESRLERLESRNTPDDLAALKIEFDRLRAELTGVGARSETETMKLEAAQDTLDQLAQRMGSLEEGLAALVVRGESPGRRMDLAEVDYLLRMASERLQLFGDGKSADQALAMADNQLEAINDPLYLPVRQSIAAARSSLSSLPELDMVVITGRVAALQSEIPSLPFPGQVQEEPDNLADPDTGDEPGIWARFKHAMSSLVTVRRRVPEDEPISLEDRDYVRQGLWLQYESARLALMRKDAAAWEKALQRAGATLDRHFDNTSRSVVEAIRETAQLLELELAYPVPDISEPWARLNLLRMGRLERAAAGPPANSATSPASQDGSGTIGNDTAGETNQPDADTTDGDGSG